MGLFAAARSARNTLWLGAALFGYYFLVSDLMRRVLQADPGPAFLVFLALLFAYGLWTRAPLVALGLTGGILFLWVVGGLARPGLSPDIDPARVGWTLTHALGPVLAVGLGVVMRALLFRRRTRSPEEPPASLSSR